MKNSALKDFHKKHLKERIRLVADFANLSQGDVDVLEGRRNLSLETAESMVENFVTKIEIPMGIATNFLINGKDYLIPMAIEEPSVIAACSYAAKIARQSGGFTCYASDPLMIGEIQIIDIPNPDYARITLMKNREKLLEMANEKSKSLSQMKAGAKDLYITGYHDDQDVLVLNLLVDVRDAMGANIVNTMCEYIAPAVEEISGGKVNLRILSNLSDRRMVHCSATFKTDLIGGKEVSRRIVKAYSFAKNDIHRAATHNKGIMNGIDAVLIATLNDWRAVEAGAHSYASMGGYGPLTRFALDSKGDVIGSISIPMAVGTVGGSMRSSPVAMVSMKILGVGSSSEFAQVLASVGLAQNFAAVRALANEGIQHGHMKLHSRNIAIAAGAKGELVDIISSRMVKEKNISPSRAVELLEQYLHNNSDRKE
ncbi:MAG: hydroxymethylglutaryl-CoA reductase, degradative [Candidatus Thermoplasmatota archaeon]|nr:hydroxymethylglutaryl-CoA reductase, degradative [Candidatus Thermoplasmatota archaeon]